MDKGEAGLMGRREASLSEKKTGLRGRKVWSGGIYKPESCLHMARRGDE